ncbi:hypothetical protein JI435_413480, partial [Parastagonospora nodorum SN15]
FDKLTMANGARFYVLRFSLRQADGFTNSHFQKFSRLAKAGLTILFPSATDPFIGPSVARSISFSRVGLLFLCLLSLVYSIIDGHVCNNMVSVVSQ